MTKKQVRVLACLGALPFLAGLIGCAGQQSAPSTEPAEARAAKPGYNQITDQGVEDSRTAVRVREALAAGADYKYDGVKVEARNGVVELSGFVSTSAQRNRAEEAASKTVGVRSVTNNLIVKD